MVIRHTLPGLKDTGFGGGEEVLMVYHCAKTLDVGK
jgi:hypothetical protein